MIKKDAILRDFLKVKNNRETHRNYLHNPTTINKKELNEKFRKHFLIIRYISYFIKMIHFESRHFDKKKRKESTVFLLNFDNDNFSSRIPAEDIYFEMSLEENITNHVIYKSLKMLSSKERLIIYHLYINNLKETEVAKLLGVSQQAVNKSKKKVLDRIRKEFNNRVK